MNTISVLIRTFNSAGTLNEVMGRLNLDAADEFVVVDSGSTDQTLDIARFHGAKILELKPPFNYSRSLNQGCAAAKGDWILVISSHCLPLRDDLIERLREAALTMGNDTAVFYGKICLCEPGSLEPVIYHSNDFSEQNRQKARGGNGFAVYRRELVMSRGFDESLVTAEDLEWLLWAWQNKYSSALVNDAVVLYRNRGSLRHMYRKGLNETLVALRLEKRKRPGFLRSLRNCSASCFYLLRLLGTGRISPSDTARLFFRDLGAFHAGVIAQPPDA